MVVVIEVVVVVVMVEREEEEEEEVATSAAYGAVVIRNITKSFNYPQISAPIQREWTDNCRN